MVSIVVEDRKKNFFFQDYTLMFVYVRYEIASLELVDISFELLRVYKGID